MTITHKTTLQTTTSVSQLTLRPFLSILLIIAVAMLTALSAHAQPVASAAIVGIENLPAGVLPFPENIKKLQRVGIPSFIKPDFDFFTVVQSLISVEINPSTGVHIGSGTILTNRHVYMSLLRTDGLKTKFKGEAPIARLISNRKMSLLELPEPSAEDLKALAKKPGQIVTCSGSTVIIERATIQTACEVASEGAMRYNEALGKCEKYPTVDFIGSQDYAQCDSGFRVVYCSHTPTTYIVPTVPAQFKKKGSQPMDVGAFSEDRNTGTNSCDCDYTQDFLIADPNVRCVAKCTQATQ